MSMESIQPTSLTNINSNNNIDKLTVNVQERIITFMDFRSSNQCRKIKLNFDSYKIANQNRLKPHGSSNLSDAYW